MTKGNKPQGEIRQSQLVTTFGPGSMMDLPNHSVLVAGLDFWSLGGEAGFGAKAQSEIGAGARRADGGSEDAATG